MRKVVCIVLCYCLVFSVLSANDCIFKNCDDEVIRLVNELGALKQLLLNIPIESESNKDSLSKVISTKLLAIESQMNSLKQYSGRTSEDLSKTISAFGILIAVLVALMSIVVPLLLLFISTKKIDSHIKQATEYTEKFEKHYKDSMKENILFLNQE